MSASFPNSLRIEARNLASAGFDSGEIVRLFARRGVDPVPDAGTVRWWLKGARNVEIQMEHQRRYRARVNAERSGGKLRTRARSTEFKLLRIAALHEIGISAAKIAVLMEFDMGEGLTESQVRHALLTGRYPTRVPLLEEAA